MLIFDIETEENLQCGVTTNPGAKSGSPTSGFKSASAAIEKAIKDAKGEKAAATATNAANAKRNAALNTSIINFSRQVTGKTKSRLKREMKARINANK